MLRTLLYIILVFFFTIDGWTTYAVCSNEGNITQSDFKIDIGCMDPVAWDTQIEWTWGVGVLVTFLGNMADLLLFTIPIIAVVSFLVAGYFYIFSAGDSEKVGRAKTIIKWNIIAIVVALLSYGIIKLIASLFT